MKTFLVTVAALGLFLSGSAMAARPFFAPSTPWGPLLSSQTANSPWAYSEDWGYIKFDNKFGDGSTLAYIYSLPDVTGGDKQFPNWIYSAKLGWIFTTPALTPAFFSLRAQTWLYSDQNGTIYSPVTHQFYWIK